jgi:hypothetical protein
VKRVNLAKWIAFRVLVMKHNTGALVIFAFHHAHEGDSICHALVCEHAIEDLVEDRIGPVEPGKKKS